MPEKVLILSHKEDKCGIHQYGLDIAEALEKSQKFEFVYDECSNRHEWYSAVYGATPDVVIYNYYQATMPWLTKEITHKYGIPALGIMHEVTKRDADIARRDIFDYHLCPDPTLDTINPIVFKTPRLIPPYKDAMPPPDVPTVGSFGFGFADKGFERVVEQVNAEFDNANISLLLPANDIVDKWGWTHARSTAGRCRQIPLKPGVHLTISHTFLSKPQLLRWLASNSLNAFFYDVNKSKGISSVIDAALAVPRPVAITRCPMFRHIWNASPSICIEDSSLKEILKNGVAPLTGFKEQWSEHNFITAYDAIIEKVLRSGR